MKKFLDATIPSNKFYALFLCVLLSGFVLLTLFLTPSFYFANDFHRQPGNEALAYLYGVTVFILYPMALGVLAPLVVGYKNKLGFFACAGWAQLTLLGVGLLFLIFAFEGAICLAMAYPIVAVMTLLGSIIGWALQENLPAAPEKLYCSFLAFIFVIPVGAFVESYQQQEPEAKPITTRVVINAPPEAVWKNVVEFPELAPPTELIFKTGIAYPIRARIEGSGVGAVRYCEFSTGAFVEPITVWNENRLLEFPSMSNQSQCVKYRRMAN